MKKNRVKPILALVLAAILALSVAGATLADGVELGDLEHAWIYSQDENEVFVDTNVQGSILESPATITTGDIASTDDPVAVYISVESDHDVTLETGAISNTSDSDYCDSAVIILTNESTSSVTFSSESITSSYDAVLIENLGTTDVSTGTIEAGGTGIHIENDNGTATVQTESITAIGAGIDSNSSSGGDIGDGDVSADAGESSETLTTITVNGDIAVTGTVSATDENDGEDGVYGIHSEVSNGASVQGEITGSITAESTSDAYGINVNAYGGTISLEAGGQTVATAENVGGGSAYATAVSAEAEGEGAEISVTLTGGASASAKGDGEEVTAAAANLRSIDGASVLFTAEGDLTAEASGDADDTTAVALFLFNLYGTIDATVTGDVSAEGGDTSIGLGIMATENSTTDVIVDGTVSGETAAVVLEEETQIGENVTLTVWQIVPDENDALVVRPDEEAETDKPSFKQDKDAEKAIQYIIRIKAGQEDIISTDAKKTGDYNYALEGERVTMKLNIPAGYEITGAFGDAAEKLSLKVDANGNYYIDIPRGGGVLLSVVKKEIPKPDSDPDSKADSNPKTNPGTDSASMPAGVKPLLTIVDTTGRVQITFFSNGNYKAVYPDNGVDTGKFRKRDEIFLVNDYDPLNEMAIEPTDSGDYRLTFTSTLLVDETFEFEIKAPYMVMLKNNSFRAKN